MSTKGLYSRDSNMINAGGIVVLKFAAGEQIPFYTNSSFIGRDAGENFRKTLGLTDWVAKNFELLELGEIPFDSRKVDSLTRARWEQFTMEFLLMIFNSHSKRAR